MFDKQRGILEGLGQIRQVNEASAWITEAKYISDQFNSLAKLLTNYVEHNEGNVDDSILGDISEVWAGLSKLQDRFDDIRKNIKGFTGV